MPQTPRAEATLLFGRAVNSYNILANVSEYLASENNISAKEFSKASSNGLFCGSDTRLSNIIAAFLQISGTGWGVLITFSNRSIALKSENQKQVSGHFSNKISVSIQEKMLEKLLPSLTSKFQSAVHIYFSKVVKCTNSSCLCIQCW